MNRLIKFWVIVVVGASGLAGCASTPVDPNDTTLSLVYGFFDMEEAKSDVRWVELKSYGDDSGYYTLAARDGIFLHVGVEGGSYQVSRFGGMGGIPFLTRAPYEYDFGSRGRNETATRITEPGVYFLGSYTYVAHPGGFFEQDKFEMEPAQTPSEKEVLSRVIQWMESDRELRPYLHQLTRAKQRLSELQ